MQLHLVLYRRTPYNNQVLHIASELINFAAKIG